MKNIGKRITSVLCAVVLLMSIIILPEHRVYAAEDGLDLSTMQIVVPASATQVEQTAASELQSYIYKITGVKPSIKTEGSHSGACVYIGATNYAKLKGVSYPTEGDENGEAWAIKIVSGSLFLCGAPARGPLYAVYHLLEDVLGVRWWSIWEEDVPKGKAIVPTGYADSGVPVMEYREVFVGKETSTDYAFYARNRMNGFTTNIPDSYGGEESYGQPAHVHTFNRYFTSEDFSAHPEWFSQVSGTRVSDGQLCLTNASLKTEFASRLVSKVAGDPDAIYSVSPNDNTKFCECSTCQSAINTYGMSGYVLRFVNEMAAAVTAAGYTDTTVEMLVYWAYLDAPTGGVVPADNVQIRFADNYIDLLHSLDHANNADTVADLKAWIDISSNNVYYWQYVVVYQNNGVLPSMFNYGDDITKLAEMGVNGWFAEQEQCINADFWDMKLWLIAKLMENPVSGEEYEALMDEFIYGYYGEESGKHIRDYLYYMHAKAEATNANQTFSTNIIDAEWLSVQDIIKGNDYFEKAVAAANGDATLLRRLRAARSGLDRVIHENFAKWQDQAADAGLTLPFTIREVGERIYQTMTEQIAIRGTYDPDYPRFYNAYENKYGENQAQIPSEFSGVEREHLLDYTTEDFRIANSAHKIVNDSDSLVGTAFVVDTASTTQSAMKSQIRISAYDPGGPNANNSSLVSIYNLPTTQLTLNSGYKLYSFSWTVKELGNDPNSYIFLFDDWGLQIPSMKTDLNNLAGKTVNIFLSIKAEGSRSYSYFNGKYYIERVIIDIAPSQPAHNYVTAPSTYGDTCRSVCSACGDVVLTPHAWNDGVVTVEPTVSTEGEKTYTCTSCGATKTETVDKLPVVETMPFDEIPIGHRESVRDYSAFATAPAEGTNYVDDAEAYNGKAVCYSKALLNDSNFISIKRYDNGKELTIGNLPLSDLKVNQGYQIYKFTYDVPADATAGGVFFIMNNWQLNSSAFTKDFAPFAGKTVEVYLSIKVTGPSEGYYSVFVDGVALASVCKDHMEDGVCTKCGEIDELLYSIPSEHLASVRYYSDFATEAGKTEYVDDAEAYGGKAVCYSKANFDGGDFLAIKRYDSGKEVSIAQLFKEDLQINDGYHIYKIEYAVPADATEGSVFFIMPNWQLNSSAFCKDFAPYAGKTVEVYLSMKITGPAADGLYSVSVDRVALATVCEDYMDEAGITCTLCGKTDELLAKIPSGHLASVRYYSDFATEAGKTEYVDDAEAYGGKAVCYSKATLDNNIFVAIKRYDRDQERQIASLTRDELNINDGYHIYQFTYDVPADTTEGSVFFIMNNWQLNSSAFCKDFAPYAGKTVEVYLSMKVTGPSNEGYYSVFVDRVALESFCEDFVSEDGTTCTLCGKTLVELPTPAKSWYLTLDGNIGMNFHLNVTAEQAASATVDVTVNGTTATKNVAELAAGEQYVLAVELAAAQMTDAVTVTLHTGDQDISKSYTVREYADYILDEANGFDAKTQELVKQMLNYGAASQTYFGYNSGLLANDGLEITAATVPSEGGEITVSGSVSGLRFYGASLVYQNKIAVRFYFIGSTAGINFGDYTVVEKNGMYYIEVADIVPQDMAQDINVSVSDGTNTLSVAYAPVDYIIRMYNKGGDSAELVQALYGYYLAAEAYTTSAV